MKLYTEEQVKQIVEKSRETGLTAEYLMLTTSAIELPSDEEIFWNTENPMYIDNYIVHRGAEGVSLGWWNGEEWIEMWGRKKLNVYGWIKIPKTPIEWMRDKILNK